MSVTKRFLIVRLSSIGDVLHATPVARTLKEKYPDFDFKTIIHGVDTIEEIKKLNIDLQNTCRGYTMTLSRIPHMGILIFELRRG